MIAEEKYILSFTAASLRLNEMVKVAAIMLDDENRGDSVFGGVKSVTVKREMQEVSKRLEQLTHEQLEIMAYGDLASQRHIAFLAVCKIYAFIRDFSVDVIRNKILVFNYQINESDYNNFIHSKIQTHPELEEFNESTLKKAKQVLFLILQQAGLINSTKERVIQPQILQPAVIKAIVKDNPLWLKIFHISDRDILNYQPK